MRRRRKIDIFLEIIILCGFAAMLYPILSDLWNQYHQSRAISSYQEKVEELSGDEYEEAWEAANAYNAELVTKLDRYHLTEEEEEEYNALLNIAGNGIMGYVEVPSLVSALSIYHGTDDEVLQVGVGHIEGSSLPVGGESTHSVLSGHRGLPSAQLFTNLDQMVVGDVFYVHVLDKTLVYQTDQIRIVLPEEIDDLEIEDGKDYCTLVTCTPYGINSHRLLVRGHRIADLEEAQESYVSNTATQIDPIIVSVFIAFPALIIMTLAVLIRARRKKNTPKAASRQTRHKKNRRK